MNGEHASDDKSPEDDGLTKIPISPELLETIPEEKREELIQQISEYSLHVEHVFSGPLPPPKMIKEYQQVVPGSGEIIFDSFVQQQKHRIEMEKQSQQMKKQSQQNTAEKEKYLLTAFIQRERLGMWLGFVLALVMLTGSFAVILSGFSTVGLISIFGSVISIAGAFAYNRYSSHKEREEREDSESLSPPKLPDGNSKAER